MSKERPLNAFGINVKPLFPLNRREPALGRKRKLCVCGHNRLYHRGMFMICVFRSEGGFCRCPKFRLKEDKKLVNFARK